MTGVPGPFGHHHTGDHHHPSEHHGGHRHGDGVMHDPRGYERGCRLLCLGRRRGVYDRLAALAGAREGDTVLDLGCGTGALTAALARRVGPSGRVVGIDPSATMIRYSRENAAIRHSRENAGPNVSFEVMGAQQLSFPDGAFDVVASSFAWHHIPEDSRSQALAEAARVLRPSGRFAVIDVQVRPRLLRPLVGLVAGRAMRHDSVAEVAARLDDRFVPVATGRSGPLLGYLLATRAGLVPQGSAPAGGPPR